MTTINNMGLNNIWPSDNNIIHNKIIIKQIKLIIKMTVSSAKI